MNPDFLKHIQVGKDVLNKAQNINSERFAAYKMLPGNEDKKCASSFYGGNIYGNTLGHTLNMLTNYTDEEEIVVFRSMNNNSFLKIKNSCIFYNKSDELIGECDQKFKELRESILDDYDFKCACISILINMEILPGDIS